MGFMLWTRSLIPKGCFLNLEEGHHVVRCHGDEALERAKSLVNIQFSWYSIWVVIFAMTLYIAMHKIYERRNEYQSLTRHDQDGQELVDQDIEAQRSSTHKFDQSKSFLLMEKSFAPIDMESYIRPNNEQNEPTQGDIGETSNELIQAKQFFQMIFPPPSKGYKLSPLYSAIKKTFKMIELGYESIHACVNDCFLFRGEDNKDKQFFPVCNASRWKDNNTMGKKVTKKVLCYFLIIPRLQCLYKSSHTAKKMTWHATGKCTEASKMQQLVDGRAWKNFDTRYLDFTTEQLNVRLALAANGFNPFESSLMLTLLIPGLKSSGKDIDVYLRPLINDIKDLWSLKGVETINVATGQTLQQYLHTDVATPIIELCSFFKQTCSQTLMEATLVKTQSQVVDILCNLKKIYPLSFFVFMIHLVIHLPQEFIRFDHQELKKVTCEFPNQDMKEEFPSWFGLQTRQCYIDKDPGVSISGELFALACGPTSSPISLNSCIVNGVRFVVHIRDERRTTQNNDICSPGERDGGMYYVSTSSNDLDFATFNIDGQSMDVDAPPDCIDVDKDYDFIDDEDIVPHDLVDSIDNVLANDDYDNVAIVYSSEEED
uniref:Transmembrane protein 45B-like n=1 Tax=Tanacetum cinerariifolium TaxID=118510 RepID=A0A6L2MYI1_TANCI|nr:transmembrane protein 45B-like [Tanacetum cinerariifolium]